MYAIKSNPFVPITSAATAENYTKNHSHFLTHLTPITFVTNCLGTNRADSSRRQDKGHAGKNQELENRSRIHSIMQMILWTTVRQSIRPSILQTQEISLRKGMSK